MNLKQSLQLAAAAALCSSVLFSAMPASGTEKAPPDAIGSVSVSGGAPVFFYDTRESGGATAMWNTAVTSGRPTTVTLYADWTSSSGTQLVGEGTGAVYDGVIYIPTGCEITIDLNGWSIDRALEASIENGEVIRIQKGGVLNLTDTTGSSGKITGGYSVNDCGGILVEGGGTLNIWGGSITGNRCEGSGGGVLLAGSDSTLYMTGGSITENHADTNGGGIASVDGNLRIVSGEINNNSAAESGGGMFLQGGSTELSGGSVDANSAATGGGICTSSEAVLTLKGEPSVQKNKASSEDVTSAGGGILAMSARPVRLGGAPLVTMNTNADGTQSNLLFWADPNRVYTSRLEDLGLTAGARISVSFTGGTDRDMLMAAPWTGPNVFSADTADFSILEEEGSLLLRRPRQKVSGWMIAVIIAAAAIVVVILVAVTGVIVKKSEQKKKRRKKKRAAH